MIVVRGGVTTAKGFVANGIASGIKKSGRSDLAVLYSEVPAVAAGSFTTNKFQASPVKISKAHLKNKLHQAIIVNSGNANCANGKAGDKDAYLMASLVASASGINEKEVLVASTGIIGEPLPIEKIKSNMAGLIGGLSTSGGSTFSEAILTTDTKAKELAVKLMLGTSTVTIGGACKGVGMIYPNMKAERHATMLAFITTDAAISKTMLEASLNEAIGSSFNMVSVDGDMSTNDSCFMLANGFAGNKRIDSKNRHYNYFVRALKFLTTELAKMLVRDGEGATKFVEIEVSGAKKADDARRVARKISTSSLLKCCIYGEDPNWGRVAAAAGASGVEFNTDKVDIYLGSVKVLLNGASVKDYDKDKVKKLFKAKDIKIRIDLKSGRYKATSWTCDFSKEYVQINSEYST